MQVKAGDLLLTRNKGGEAANESPGYYNHSAIISVQDWVVESQATPNAVIAVPIWSFFERYPEILVLRPPAGVAQQTAKLAPLYLGRQYSTYMSVRPLWLWKNTDSCISLLRRIYNKATGYDYRWRIPDSLLTVSWLKSIALKKDYENYQAPVETYKGMAKVWPNRPAKDFY